MYESDFREGVENMGKNSWPGEYLHPGLLHFRFYSEEIISISKAYSNYPGLTVCSYQR